MHNRIIAAVLIACVTTCLISLWDFVHTWKLVSLVAAWVTAIPPGTYVFTHLSPREDAQ